MGAEFSGVLAGNVVLVSIVFEDNQIGDCANESNLTDFLFEAQEKDNAVVLRDIHFAPKVTPQVSLLGRRQPAQVTLAVRGNAFIQAIQNGSLFFLDQK